MFALFEVGFIVDVLVALFEFHGLENSASFFSVFLPGWEFNAWLVTAGNDFISTAVFSFPRSDEIFDIFFDSVGWGGEIVVVVTVEVTAKTSEFVFVLGSRLDVDGVTVPSESVAVAGDGWGRGVSESLFF